MPALNEGTTGPNYLPTYAKSGVDPTLSALLSASNIPYWIWSSLPATEQKTIATALKNYQQPIGAPGEAFSLETGQVLPYLVQNGYLNAQSQELLISGAGASGVAKSQVQQQVTTASQAKAAAAANKNLVGQPHAAGGAGGAGVPGGAYSVPQVTSGQLANLLKSQGFNFPFDIEPFIKTAIKSSNGDATTAMSSFLATLYKSAQFKHYYPSYFAPNGTARFSSPGDYDQKFNQYQSVAQRQGFKLTRQQFGNVANAGKSIDEFTADTQIAGTIKNNGALLKNFNSIAASSGVKGLHSAQDAYNFLTGRGDPKQYQVWNAAAGVTAAKAAGVNVSTSEAKSATGGLQSAVSYDDIEKSYADLAQKVKDSGAELGAFGVSQRDLETLEFGGANRSLIAARVSQAMAQTAAQGQGVSSAVTTTAAGVPVAAQQQQAGE